MPVLILCQHSKVEMKILRNCRFFIILFYKNLKGKNKSKKNQKKLLYVTCIISFLFPFHFSKKYPLKNKKVESKNCLYEKETRKNCELSIRGD
jgi:hypothetical protein